LVEKLHKQTCTEENKVVKTGASVGNFFCCKVQVSHCLHAMEMKAGKQRQVENACNASDKKQEKKRATREMQPLFHKQTTALCKNTL
jgi:hypothetical protein